MKPKNISKIIDDPLLGSRLKKKDDWEGLVMLIEPRLSFLAGSDRSRSIVNQILTESETITIWEGEYIINELLFEIRRNTAVGIRNTGDNYEEMLFQQWCKMLLVKHSENVVLEFVSMIIENRKRRM